MDRLKPLSAIPAFYTEKMVADSESYSPSAAKPRDVMKSWRRRAAALDVREPEPVTPQQLMAAHDPDYVKAVLGCRQANGFGNRSSAVARSLPYTSGAMLAAARAALANAQVAVAPCSGFHHACYDIGGGFCTFNGLMVAAKALLDENAVKRVGILDFDQHWGNGTDDIIRHLGLKHQVRHYHPGNYGAARFLRDIPLLVGKFSDCDLVLYQAGADPHIDDPLGGWLTTPQLQERDRLVFSALQEWSIPVAWNLAGGYQRDAAGSIRPVLEIHDNTLDACVAAYLPNSRLRVLSASDDQLAED